VITIYNKPQNEVSIGEQVQQINHVLSEGKTAKRFLFSPLTPQENNFHSLNNKSDREFILANLQEYITSKKLTQTPKINSNSPKSPQNQPITSPYLATGPLPTLQSSVNQLPPQTVLSALDKMRRPTHNEYKPALPSLPTSIHLLNADCEENM